jgi:hypothetical protein
VPHTTDLDLTPKEVVGLASPDAIASFLAWLGYDTDDRAVLSPEAVGLSGESASAIKRIELLSEDPEQFLRVVFAQPKSLTAKVRNDLVRVLGRSTLDHLIVLASDFDALEFVFLDKRKREQKGPAASERIQVVPKTISVNRRSPTRLDLRTLRRFTWTCRDALEQFDKLRSVFDAAAYTDEYFQNRGLFSDYFLRDRLREDPAWRENPSELFAFVRDLLRDAQARWGGKDKETLRNQILEPLFKKLDFKATVNRPSKTDQTQPDYLLKAGDRGKLTAAFVYSWDRWLDGPDLNDADTPEENPGACVVTALDQGIADWIVVTNGRLWRLYSRQAHARATNFYEVDLVEALTASGDTDPNEAFRVSSFLGNVYLLPIDMAFGSLSRRRDLKYLRYMDDIKVLAKDMPSAREALFLMNERLRTLRLNIQASKTRILQGNEIADEFFDERMDELEEIIAKTQKNRELTTSERHQCVERSRALLR